MSVIAWFRPTQPGRRSLSLLLSLPHLHGESKTASVGSISRVSATDIENIIVKSLNEHLIAQKEKPASSQTHVRDGKTALEQVVRIDVHEDRLAAFG